MTTARRTQVSLDCTPYYHCIARCVRRAFLCGDDQYSGKNFDHRRQWLVDRMARQASVFAIDICAYAIMGNHYHLVLRIDSARADHWSDDEVLLRWCQLFKGPILARKYLAGEALSAVERDTVSDIAAVWRDRLSNISWFMRCLNEFIARQANAEDDCKGRFWEGRFKSQALLDEPALLSCMAYVDLNPVRAGMADTLEDSTFTSIQARLQSIAAAKRNPDRTTQSGTILLPFAELEHASQIDNVIPFTLEGYIDLVDWTGRVARQDKRGVISEETPAALQQLGLDSEQWLGLSLEIQQASLRAIGSMETIQRYNHSLGKHWLSGQQVLGRLYNR